MRRRLIAVAVIVVVAVAGVAAAMLADRSDEESKPVKAYVVIPATTNTFDPRLPSVVLTIDCSITSGNGATSTDCK